MRFNGFPTGVHPGSVPVLHMSVQPQSQVLEHFDPVLGELVVNLMLKTFV
jgi:hypothetical protein